MLAIVSAEHVFCPFFIGMLGSYCRVIITMLFISFIIIHVKLFNMEAYLSAFPLVYALVFSSPCTPKTLFCVVRSVVLVFPIVAFFCWFSGGILPSRLRI